MYFVSVWGLSTSLTNLSLYSTYRQIVNPYRRIFDLIKVESSPRRLTGSCMKVSQNEQHGTIFSFLRTFGFDDLKAIHLIASSVWLCNNTDPSMFFSVGRNCEGRFEA